MNTQKTIAPIIAANSGNGRIYNNWGLFQDGVRIATIFAPTPEREHELAMRLEKCANEYSALVAVAEAVVKWADEVPSPYREFEFVKQARIVISGGAK